MEGDLLVRQLLYYDYRRSKHWNTGKIYPRPGDWKTKTKIYQKGMRNELVPDIGWLILLCRIHPRPTMSDEVFCGKMDKPETLPLSVPAFFDLGANFPFPLPAFGNFHDALWSFAILFSYLLISPYSILNTTIPHICNMFRKRQNSQCSLLIFKEGKAIAAL